MCLQSFSSGLSVMQIDARMVTIHPDELAARLGAGTDASFSELLEAKLAELRQAASCRAVYREVPVQICENNCALGDFFAPVSKTLARSLEGCKRAYLFAATLGLSVDRLIARCGALSAAEQFMADALASALIEGVCDYAQAMLPSETAARCSPGYGDFDLGHQAKLLESIHADQTLGILLTTDTLMVPTKSVSAVIGIRI